MIKKENREVLIYIIIFLGIILLPKTVFLVIQPYTYGLAQIESIGIFASIIITIITVQIFLTVILSIWAISSKNNILTNLYNNYRVPTLFLILFIGIDLLINVFFPQNDEIKDYFLFYSLTKNFIPIYLVAIINTIRLKTQKQEQDV